MKLELAKGVRDLPPEMKIIREEMVDTLKKIFKKYGFNPLETPIIERYKTLSDKYAGGSEILKETFKLKDQGNRELGLRYDLTVPFSRFVAMNPQIKFPFKRYQIGRVFRDGPIKLGRTREFWQCDVDVVGVKNMLADAEVIALASEFFKKTGIDVVIKVNNRKILDSMMEEAGIVKGKRESAMIILDKLEKVGVVGVKKELKEKGINGNELLKIIKSKKLNLKNREGLEELKELEKYLKIFGITNYEIDYTLARGLSYYTGTVFEIKSKDLGGSLGGGGRFDNMIGNFIGDDKNYPAVGISFGLEPIFEVLKKKRKSKKTVTQIYVTPIKTLEKSLRIVKKLRDSGINVDVDLVGRGLSKNLSYANSYGIPYVLIIGDKEIKSKKFTLRDMKTGKEQKIEIEKIKKKFI